MQNHPNDNHPDELKIEQLLSAFKPQPTPRLNARMSSAPWFTQDHSRSGTEAKTWTHRMTPTLAIAVIILVLVIITLGFIPSVRVAADQFIHFFLPAASDRLEVQVTPANPLVTLDFSNPSNFPLNIREVQQQAGFLVKEIPFSTAAPAFIGARYEPELNAALLLYQGKNYTLLLTQRPLGNSQDVFSIGSNAHVEFVKVGDIQAEYVVGGWTAVSTQTPSGTPSSSGGVHISAVWDDTLPQATLRWQEAGYAYELRTNGVNMPSQSQLINLSNELK